MENKILCKNIIFPESFLPECFTNKYVFDSIPNILAQYGNCHKMLEENFRLNTNGSINCFRDIVNLNYGVTKGTEPIQFIGAKSSGGNRVFSIPNPLIQIPLHAFVLNNAEFLLSKQSEDSDEFMSNSKYYYDSEKVYTYNPYFEGEDVEVQENIVQDKYLQGILNKYKISDGKYYSMKIDVSSCYNNIYTHMISWLSGSEDEKIVLENFDKIIRNTYNGETKGIPIGPYTSGLFSEILFSKIDNAIKKEIKNGKAISFVRNVDDFEIYADSKELLNDDIKYIIENELAKLKLEINYNKLSFKEFPFFKLPNYVIKEVKEISEVSAQSESSSEVVERMIRVISNNLDKNISDCKYSLIQIYSNIKNDNIKFNSNDENEVVSYFIDYLINLAFKYNYLVKQCFELIIVVIEKTNVDTEKLINKLISKRAARKSHIREIVDIWIVYLITCLDLNNDEISRYFETVSYESDIALIIILNYCNNKNLLEKNKEWLKKYFNDMKVNLLKAYDGNWQLGAWISKYWLLLYMNQKEWKIHQKQGFKDTIFVEVDIEKLCSDNDAIAKRLNLFNILLQQDVTFFEENDKE